MRTITRVVLAAVVLLPLAGCGDDEPKSYGPTVAGPTRTSSPQTGKGPADAPTTPGSQTVAPKIVTTGTALCKLYSTADIAGRLGKPVGAGVPFKDGPYVGCAWKAGKSGDVQVKGGRVIPTVVTLTRGPARYYAAYQTKITALAKSRKASGDQVVRGIGDEAFAIGSSVKGVPIWYGGTRRGGWLTGVEMSGAKTKAGIVAVSDLLLDTLERG